VNLPGTGDKSGSAVELVHWYDKLEGLVDVNAPALAVAFANGRVNLLRNETDTQPILIDTGLVIQVLRCRAVFDCPRTNTHSTSVCPGTPTAA
jgi:hypothetical protein